MSARSLSVHLGLTVFAAALAAQAWLAKGDTDEQTSEPVWSGDAERIEAVEFISKDRVVKLQAAKDERGRYFVAEVEREQPEPPKNPHAPPEEQEPEQPEAQEPKPRETLRFVAGTDAEQLIELLAPLKSLRALGQLDANRYEEFGFGEGETSTLKVNLQGNTRELVVGGKTPGGSDRYVRTADAAQAYVIEGQIVRDLESAETRLMQRNLHAWEDDEVGAVKLLVGDEVRQLVKDAEKRAHWADAQTPTEKDETASNWMGKLDRVRLVEYYETVQPPPEPVFRVEYTDTKGKPLGFVEVASRPSQEGDKPEYLARSEQTRWWGKMLQSLAEQLAGDVTSLVTR